VQERHITTRASRYASVAGEQYVDQFDTAEDRYGKVRRNPVTGGSFLRGLDPIQPQKAMALSADRVPGFPLTRAGDGRACGSLDSRRPAVVAAW
jgi:hypothetical protein